MKKTGLFTLLSCIGFYYVFSLADGYTDAFYVKFTTPKQTSLIIGSSRAAQGLQPKHIDSVLGTSNLYNYAFSRVHTPYGKPYLESIKRKLKPSKKNGIYIIEVNPWAICNVINTNENKLSFPESNSFAGGIKRVSSDPNLSYLIQFYEGRNIDILKNRNGNYYKEKLFVHSDGWYNVKLNDTKEKKRQRFDNAFKGYSKLLNIYSDSIEKRLKYLDKTVKYLALHGKVYILRLPVDQKMLDIENKLLPKFDIIMDSLSKSNDVKYYNFMKLRSEVDFIDGHHLDSLSGSKISKLLALKITNKYFN